MLAVAALPSSGLKINGCWDRGQPIIRRSLRVRITIPGGFRHGADDRVLARCRLPESGAPPLAANRRFVDIVRSDISRRRYDPMMRIKLLKRAEDATAAASPSWSLHATHVRLCSCTCTRTFAERCGRAACTCTHSRAVPLCTSRGEYRSGGAGAERESLATRLPHIRSRHVWTRMRRTGGGDG
jgi:hypothetical protein